ncbi:MAG: hypothetical protein A2V98_18140 [Planctomycetes bacterium RBG_16_64_12]|nr:MAG: hypothetical protein A2V98_18140 [Planctomycetes bacterium RBG_16_64_12]
MKSHLVSSCLLTLAIVAPVSAETILQTRFLRLTIGDTGLGQSLVDRTTGAEYCVSEPARPAFSVVRAGREHFAQSVRRDGQTLGVSFMGIGTTAQFRLKERDYYGPKDFEAMLSLAEDIGFRVQERPHVRLSRAAVLVKG